MDDRTAVLIGGGPTAWTLRPSDIEQARAARPDWWFVGINGVAQRLPVDCGAAADLAPCIAMLDDPPASGWCMVPERCVQDWLMQGGRHDVPRHVLWPLRYHVGFAGPSVFLELLASGWRRFVFVGFDGSKDPRTRSGQAGETWQYEDCEGRMIRAAGEATPPVIDSVVVDPSTGPHPLEAIPARRWERGLVDLALFELKGTDSA